MEEKATQITVQATEIEVEIVKCLSEDHTVAQVASIIGINKRTLDAKVAAIKSKYGLRSIGGLIWFFGKRGWIK